VTTVPILELRPGGRYRVEMRKGDATHVVVGEYREIRPPKRLVYTWKWEVSEMGGRLRRYDRHAGIPRPRPETELK
jgi:uncharacterized protein YndB with AHSA1/START domain